MQLPKHLAIIMDGNGRWAQSRGHNRAYGHVRGARVAKNVIESCAQLGLENLTLFAFSTENWLRPKSEVSVLMNLLERQLKRERKNLIRNNIKFQCIGDLSRLPESVKVAVDKTVEQTKDCKGMNLVFALSYGGRQELVFAMKNIAAQVKAGLFDIDEIDEKLVAANLESSFLPDPEVILRTSGESRLSNFCLWQSAYSELIINKKYWPDFTVADLKNALREYSTRNRRFGQILPDNQFSGAMNSQLS